jgi:Zn-dependent protease
MELRLGTIPVRIRGWFFVMALLLGSNERDPTKLGTWVLVVLVSVVIHELGHALVGRAFGLLPRVELHGMGGTTSFERPPPAPGAPPHRPLGAVKNVAISLAGPFAGFLFALVVFGAELAGLRPTHPLLLRAVELLFVVNIGWGIFNLVPMLPLDGGNVLRAILVGIAKEKGDRIARIVSIVIAAAIALFAVRQGQWWILYLGVLFAFRNVQALKEADAQARVQDQVQRQVQGQMQDQGGQEDLIEAAYQAYDRGAWAEVQAILGPLVLAAAPGIPSSPLRVHALRVYVGALFEEGRLPDVLALIERERPLIPVEDVERYSERLREMGRNEEADKMAALGPPPAVLSEFRA